MDNPALLPAGDDLSAVLRDYVHAAHRLEQTHTSLRGEVARLRAELASKDRELERRRRLAAIGELAAGVAHEVRNPLGAISLYSGLLRNACSEQRAAVELIEKIERGVTAIDRVVRDTLALAPSRGQFQRVSIKELIDRCADVCQPVLSRANVALHLRAPDASLHVPADEDGLQRVLVNLITNAADASPPGAAIEVSATALDELWIELTVADRGGGIPEAALEKLFDPFFTTKAHGTGLGLSIAFRLVEAHGGRLRAANRPEGGAEFTVTLPTAANPASAAEPSDMEDQSADRRTSAA